MHCLDNAKNIMHNYDRPKYQEKPNLEDKMWKYTITRHIFTLKKKIIFPH